MQVVDRDTRRGVESDIELVDTQSTSKRVGPTDENGYFTLVSCIAGNRLRAIPKSQQYFAKAVECPPNGGIVFLQRILYFATLKTNAVTLEKLKKNGDAALGWSEISQRAPAEDKDAIKEAESKAYEQFGIAIGHTGVTTTFDPLQGKTVVTQEFRDAIKSYQKRSGIPVTGMLDYKTLSATAESPIGTYMFQRLDF